MSSPPLYDVILDSRSGLGYYGDGWEYRWISIRWRSALPLEEAEAVVSELTVKPNPQIRRVRIIETGTPY